MLLTAITNISNTIVRNQITEKLDRENIMHGLIPSSKDTSVAKIAANTDYSDFYKHEGLSKGETGTNFGTGSSHMQKLLKDTTGDGYSVSRYGKNDDPQNIISQWSNDETNSAYIIANVGIGNNDHFVNVTGVSKDKEGNQVLEYFNTDGTDSKTYTMNNVKGAYVIEDQRQVELKSASE